MNNQEILANTYWANESICMHFAEENIDHKYLGMFYFFVRRSFGYGVRYTNRITTKEISKLTKLSEPTVISYIKYLTEKGFIKVNKSNKFIKDGGSEAYSYSPCYPKGFGKIKFKEDLTSSSEVSNKTIEPEREELWSENKKIDF